MKKTIIFSVLALAGSLTLSSCGDDFLDAKQKSDIDADTYFGTEKGFENLSTTPYYKLRNLYGDSPLLFCSGTDLYTRGRSNYASQSLSLYKDLSASDDNVRDFYQNCYDGIQQCNTVIYYNNKSAEDAPRRVDEAKTLKAFYYYLLTQQFGSVPVSDHYIASVETSFPRIPQDSVYNYIISQLKDVESAGNLPSDDHTGRVSLRFVYNLLAKTYLAYGWDYGTKSDANGDHVTVTDKTNFQLAAQYADKAINGQKPSMTFSDMWNVANEDNADIIFAIKYTRGIVGQDETEDGNRQEAQFGNYYNDDSGAGGLGLTKYTTSQFPASERLLYLFEPGDDRFDGTFMVEQLKEYKRWYKAAEKDTATVYGYFPAWYTDLSKLTSYNSSEDRKATASVYSSSDPCVYIKATVNKRTGKIKYTKGTESYETARTSNGTSLCIRKFDDYTSVRKGTNKVSFHDIVLAHLTETYLLGAEAYYMAGDEAKALEYVNVVRARSHASQLTSFASYIRHYSDGTANSYNNGKGIANVPYETNLDPIDVILDERARELCGEYYRWMDLRRTKRLIKYNVLYNGLSEDNFIGPDGAYRWFRPFPQDEINLNKGIDDSQQTPGYVTSKD